MKRHYSYIDEVNAQAAGLEKFAVYEKAVERLNAGKSLNEIVPKLRSAYKDIEDKYVQICEENTLRNAMQRAMQREENQS